MDCIAARRREIPLPCLWELIVIVTWDFAVNEGSSPPFGLELAV